MSKMSEDQIERWYERATDALDHGLTVTHYLNQAEYDKAVRRLDAEFKNLLSGRSPNPFG